MQTVNFAVAVLIAYLIGAIPTGYLVVRQLKGIDVRTLGSGNTGATNVKRAAGGKAALFVLFCDFLKGLLPVLAVRWLFPNEPLMHILVALATVIGHSKSIFLGFSGGKSAATGLGGLFALAPLGSLGITLVAALVMRLSRIVSLGSISAGVAAPLILYLLHAPTLYVVYAGAVSLYVIVLHRANIVRLLNGTENRL